MYSKEIKEICQDVIARIESHKTIPQSGFFISNRKYFPDDVPSVKNFLQETVCNTCAKGALLVSFISSKDTKYSMDDLNQFGFDIDKDGYPEELLQIFGRELLDKIEVNFELEDFPWTSNSVNRPNYKRYKKLSEEERLLLIMKDIINDVF